VLVSPSLSSEEREKGKENKKEEEEERNETIEKRSGLNG